MRQNNSDFINQSRSASPIGSLVEVPLGTSSIDANYVRADDSIYSNAQYPNLAALLGPIFKAGPQSTFGNIGLGVNDAVFAFGAHFMVGNDGIISTTDGITLTHVLYLPAINFLHCRYVNGVLFAFTQAASNVVYYSTNGTTFQRLVFDTAITGSIQDVCFFATKYWFCTASNTLVSTSNLTNFTQTAPANYSAGSATLFLATNGVTMAVVKNNTTNNICTTVDGVTWNAPVTGPGTANPLDFVVMNGNFIVCHNATTNNLSFSATPGTAVSWTTVSVGSTAVYGIVWNGTRYIAYTPQTAVYAIAGTTLTTISTTVATYNTTVTSTPGGVSYNTGTNAVVIACKYILAFSTDGTSGNTISRRLWYGLCGTMLSDGSYWLYGFTMIGFTASTYGMPCFAKKVGSNQWTLYQPTNYLTGGTVTQQSVRGLALLGGKYYFALNYNDGANYHWRVYSSPDLVTFTQTFDTTDATLANVDYTMFGDTNIMIAAFAAGGNPTYSTDGVTWTASTGALSSKSVLKQKVNGYFVALGATSGFSLSVDGIVWAPNGTTPVINSVLGVAYGNGKWAVITSVAMYTSIGSDSTAFNNAVSLNGVTGTMGSITYALGRFIVGGGSAAYATIDGTRLDLACPTGGTPIEMITVGNDVFVTANSGTSEGSGAGSGVSLHKTNLAYNASTQFMAPFVKPSAIDREVLMRAA